MAAPNLLSCTSMVVAADGGAVGTSLANTIANAAASGTAVVVRSLSVANIHATNQATIEVSWYDTVNDRHYVKNATLQPGYSLTFNCPIFLQENRAIRMAASVASTLEWAGSYETWS